MVFHELIPIVNSTFTNAPTVDRNQVLELSRISNQFKTEYGLGNPTVNIDWSRALNMSDNTQAFVLSGFQGNNFGSLSQDQTFVKNYELVFVQEFIRKTGRLIANSSTSPSPQIVLIMSFSKADDFKPIIKV